MEYTLAERWLAQHGLDKDEQRDLFEQFGSPGTCRRNQRKWIKIVSEHLHKLKQTPITICEFKSCQDESPSPSRTND